MLDENLPAFFLKASTDGVAHHRSVFLSHHGSDPAPAYVVHHADPNSNAPGHKNCYAAALFDAYNPEVLFGEVLARPGWTQPSLSQEELRKNGGIPRPPQPVLPTEFVIQLYNPDQQVTVELKEGKWGGSDSWQFSIPEEVFRMPSTSVLDHGQSDPASLATTPRINFVWRKEGKLSKELTCYMTGKSTDTKRKNSRKDPDIAIALWRQMRELTIYEPNLVRIDLEDPKGLEIVLLLSAIVIRDLYHTSKDRIYELFNVIETPGRKGSGGAKTYAAPPTTSNISGAVAAPGLPPRSSTSAQDRMRNNLPRIQTTPPNASSSHPPPPLADPRAQWELDAETARLKAQSEAEKRAAEQKRREKEKADERERRRLQKMVEEEEKAARNRQAEIDRETARLRKLYGVTPIPQHPRHQQYSQPTISLPPSANWQPQQQNAHTYPPRINGALGSNGLYAHQASSSSLGLPGTAGPSAAASSSGLRPTKKKSFFGLRSLSDDATTQQRLNKKSSSMW